MKIDLIWRSKDLADLKENWDALYERDPEAHYFLSWPFLSSFLRRFDGSWFVLAARQDPEASAYAALLPLRFKAKMNLKTGQLSNEIIWAGVMHPTIRASSLPLNLRIALLLPLQGT